VEIIYDPVIMSVTVQEESSTFTFPNHFAMAEDEDIYCTSTSRRSSPGQGLHLRGITQSMRAPGLFIIAREEQMGGSVFKVNNALTVPNYIHWVA